MQLTIRALETQTYEFAENETVANIKALVASKENIDVEEQLLYCGGVPLTDDSLLLSSVLSHGAAVEVTVRLLGGKVHGSLARAGKVKGQTPKVEKQEKRKKKTGRAKRRFQYNRRFVNVVQGFGKRKGPNSNST